MKHSISVSEPFNSGINYFISSKQQCSRLIIVFWSISTDARNIFLALLFPILLSEYISLFWRLGESEEDMFVAYLDCDLVEFTELKEDVNLVS